MKAQCKPVATLTDEGLRDVFVSPNVADANHEPANVVDVLDRIANEIDTVFTDENGFSLAEVVKELVNIGSDAGNPIALSIHEGSTEIASAVDDLAKQAGRVADGLFAIAKAMEGRSGE